MCVCVWVWFVFMWPINRWMNETTWHTLTLKKRMKISIDFYANEAFFCFLSFVYRPASRWTKSYQITSQCVSFIRSHFIPLLFAHHTLDSLTLSPDSFSLSHDLQRLDTVVCFVFSLCQNLSFFSINLDNFKFRIRKLFRSFFGHIFVLFLTHSFLVYRRRWTEEDTRIREKILFSFRLWFSICEKTRTKKTKTRTGNSIESVVQCKDTFLITSCWYTWFERPDLIWFKILDKYR